jgi:arylsulfatase A-like enzyme
VQGGARFPDISGGIKHGSCFKVINDCGLDSPDAFSHRLLMKSLAVCTSLIVLAMVSWTGAAPAAKPNIIWIMADDLGYGDLGCYGAKDIPTPHIDSLAAEGVRCETFYAAASTCSPSRASILSGRYPEALGIGGALMGEGGLPADVVTVAETLKRNGYATGLIGKWHLGYEGDTLPNQQGFDEFYGHRGGKIDYFTHYDTAQKVKGSKDGKHDFYENDKEIFPEGYATELFTDRAVAYLDEKKEKPFFLFLSYNAPHYARPGVLQAPESYLMKFDEPNPNKKRLIYTAMVSCMDDGIGKVLEALKRNGLEENTIVMFVSDNGGDPSSGGNNAPFSGMKWSLKEGGIRVPMIIKWPGKLPTGVTSKEILHMIDCYPTMLAAAGIPVSADNKISGSNVLDVLKGKSSAPERPLFFGKDTVRKGKWKLSGASLHDLEADPQEKVNLAAEQPKVVEEMQALIQGKHR